MIPRAITPTIRRLAGKFPIISLTGPRQSGKSTLLRSAFADYDYVSLEDRDARALATTDPRALLARYDRPTVFDEAQTVPDLFSYLQGIVDEPGFSGSYILSGSQNFLLLSRISQSLAGRVAVLALPPLSLQELQGAGLEPESSDVWLAKGGYPRLWDRSIDPVDYFPNYITTYLDRDARQGAGILRLDDFNRMVSLCAQRTSQLLNVSSLARDVGVSVSTAGGWLSALDASYITFKVQPYFANLGKRLVKTPKLYFWDTGLAASLAGLEDVDDLLLDERRGALFENAIATELLKRSLANGRQVRLSFWREASGREVDFVIERGGRVAWLLECRASSTFHPKYFRALDAVGDLLDVPVDHRAVVYGGTDTLETSRGLLIGYRDVGMLLDAPKRQGDAGQSGFDASA